MLGYKKKYRVIEVLREETKEHSGEAIVRTISYDTKEEARARMEKMQPIENGTLKIEAVFDFHY